MANVDVISSVNKTAHRMSTKITRLFSLKEFTAKTEKRKSWVFPWAKDNLNCWIGEADLQTKSICNPLCRWEFLRRVFRSFHDSSRLLPTRYYQHFMLLREAIYILSGTDITSSEIYEARIKLTEFVGNFQSLYGLENVYSNVKLFWQKRRGQYFN